MLQQDFADEGDIFTTRETQRFIRITYARQIERRGVSRHQHNLQDAHGHVPQFDNEERFVAAHSVANLLFVIVQLHRGDAPAAGDAGR